MDEFETTKSCWGVAFWAVTIFAGTVALASAMNRDAEIDMASADNGPVLAVSTSALVPATVADN